MSIFKEDNWALPMNSGDRKKPQVNERILSPNTFIIEPSSKKGSD